MCSVRIKIRWMVPHLWIYSCFLSEAHTKRIYHTLGILIITRIWAERTKPFAKCDNRHEPTFYKEWMHTTWNWNELRWVKESTHTYRRGWEKMSIFVSKLHIYVIHVLGSFFSANGKQFINNTHRLGDVDGIFLFQFQAIFNVDFLCNFWIICDYWLHCGTVHSCKWINDGKRLWFTHFNV